MENDMGETENNLQAALAKLSEISKKGFGIAKDSFNQSSHTVKESIAHSSHTVRVKLDINTLQRESKRLSTDLGEEVFAAIKAGKLKSNLFDDLVNNLTDLKAKIEEKTKDLEKTSVETSGESNSDNLSEKTAAVKNEEKEKTEE